MPNHDSPRPGRSFRLCGSPEEQALAVRLLESEGFAWEPLAFAAPPALPSMPDAPASTVVLGRALEEPTAAGLSLGASLAARFGRLYIQDASSMLPPLVLAPPPGSMVLDMCSSPGSKTGLLSHLVGPAGLVVANEPNPERHATLRRTLQETQRLNVVVCRHEGQSLPLPGGFFEHIQLDPPCSGWGTAAKHPRVTALWKDDKIKPLVALQRALLREAARLLAPGGRLVYSTCTTNVAENEAQAAWAMETLGLRLLPAPALPGLALAEPAPPLRQGECLLVDGERGEGQGFFVALFTKDRADAAAEAEAFPGHPPGVAVEPARLREAGADLGDWDGLLADFSGACHFLPRLALARLPAALRWQGIPLGRLTPKGFAVHARSWGLLGPRAPAARLEADLDGLRGLLAGRSLSPHPAAPPGTPPARHMGLVWNGLPLGWLQVKGARALWTG